MTSEPSSLVGTTATGPDGGVLGTVTAVWLDDATGQPSWVGLTEGAHASPGDDAAVVVAPLDGARTTDGGLRLAVPASLTRGAPRLSATQRLTPEDEVRLRGHYAGGRPEGTAGAPTATDATTTDARATDARVTRSEERLTVQRDVVPWGRAVLRVETVTEEVMVPVTVTRQRVRIEHLPLTTAAASTGSIPPGPEGQATDWVTLWGEQPVVSVERVPVERVRLRTDWVTDQDTITGTLAREEIAVETTGDVAPPR